MKVPPVLDHAPPSVENSNIRFERLLKAIGSDKFNCTHYPTVKASVGKVIGP
jgi:hypothetical protein